MTVTKRGRGRPKIAEKGISVTLQVDSTKVAVADRLAESGLVPGLKLTRYDVLRMALANGLEAMAGGKR